MSRRERPGHSDGLGLSTSSTSDESSRRRDDKPGTSPGNRAEDEVPVGLMPETTGQIPPVQVMERTGESSSSLAYKFPSSVFARNRSNAQAEWSTASNESLFSIHMGSTSIRKEMYWHGRSGELGKSGQLGKLDGHVTPVSPFSIEFTKFSVSNTATTRGTDSWNVDSRPVDSQTGLLKEPSVRSPTGASGLYRSQSSRRSDASGASVKSFAFAILTGDDRGSSHKSVRLDSSTKPLTNVKKTQPDPTTPRPETPNKQPQNTKQGGWFSCLSCPWGNCL